MTPFRQSVRALVLACFAILSGCERQARPGVVEAEQQDVPTHEVSGVSFVISNDGRARMRIVAPYMAEYERGDSAYTIVSGVPGAKGGRVKVDVYDVTGAVSANIEADRLQYDGAGEQYDVNGKVVVVTPEGRRLEGEHLAWYEAEGKVRTPGFVRITSPAKTVQGFSLVAEEDLSSYSLARVTGQIVIEE